MPEPHPTSEPPQTLLASLAHLGPARRPRLDLLGMGRDDGPDRGAAGGHRGRCCYRSEGTGWSTGRKPVATGGAIDVGYHNVGTGFLPVLPSRDQA